jgi:hypothetical protein
VYSNSKHILVIVDKRLAADCLTAILNLPVPFLLEGRVRKSMMAAFYCGFRNSGKGKKPHIFTVTFTYCCCLFRVSTPCVCYYDLPVKVSES